ncbi:hypothetical protein Tco_1507061, partial [Tanacetum coccineum]
TSTNTSLVRCSKVIEANLLSASAFLFWFLRTFSIVKVSKPFRTSFTFSKYCLIISCLPSKIPFIWLAISWESVKMARLLISISRAIRNPTSHALYSALFFVVLNSKHRAYVYSLPSGLISISPAPEPLDLDALSVKSFHMLSNFRLSFLVSILLITTFSPSSRGILMEKSFGICVSLDPCSPNSMSCSPNSMAYLAIRPDFSELMSICLTGASVNTLMGCPWKYLQSLLAACTSAKISFSIAG